MVVADVHRDVVEHSSGSPVLPRCGTGSPPALSRLSDSDLRGVNCWSTCRLYHIENGSPQGGTKYERPTGTVRVPLPRQSSSMWNRSWTVDVPLPWTARPSGIIRRKSLTSEANRSLLSSAQAARISKSPPMASTASTVAGLLAGHRCTIHGEQFDPFLDYFINREPFIDRTEEH